DREARALEQPAYAGLAVREARGPAGLLPLVVVKRDEGEDLAGLERAARPLGDRIGHAEIGDDRVGLERHVLLDLDIADDEADVGEVRGGGLPPRLVDRAGIEIDAEYRPAERRQRHRHSPRAGPRVENGQLTERLGRETPETRR